MIKSDVDILIIGAGPAGLAAAVYAARAGRSVVVLEKELMGGQVATIDRVDNYPGYQDGVDGMSLASNMVQQAKRFGAKIEFGTVTGLENDGNTVQVHRDSGMAITARAVLIATGSSYRHLNIPGEKEYVHYCATCDGTLYQSKNLVTVGGANTAVQEALYLSGIASHITMLVRSYIKADDILKDKLKEKVEAGKIEVLEGWRPTEIMGNDGAVTGVKVANTNGETKYIPTDGIFVFAGMAPNTDFLKNAAIKLDVDGRIIADNYLTTMPNVYVAGDVRSGAVRQIVTAAGEGAAAMTKINHFLDRTEA